MDRRRDRTGARHPGSVALVGLRVRPHLPGAFRRVGLRAACRARTSVPLLGPRALLRALLLPVRAQVLRDPRSRDPALALRQPPLDARATGDGTRRERRWTPCAG